MLVLKRLKKILIPQRTNKIHMKRLQTVRADRHQERFI